MDMVSLLNEEKQQHQDDLSQEVMKNANKRKELEDSLEVANKERELV